MSSNDAQYIASPSHAPTATLIDGRALAGVVRGEVAERVKALTHRGVTPRLDVILAGGHTPSEIYVKYKVKAAHEVGIHAEIHRFPASVTSDTLCRVIRTLNESADTHGILVQLPLPEHIPSECAWEIVETVDPRKDVDGLHPINQGLIGLSPRGFTACTPLGCLRLIEHTLAQQDRALSGMSAVVIGRSRIVGRPLSLLLTAQNATVTLCHSRTRDLESIVGQAELVVVAAGAPRLVKGGWLKSGAIVIDVGIHRQSNGRLCGDVDFESVRRDASAITPVPGGVGPMTIASLMHNVCVAAERTFL